MQRLGSASYCFAMKIDPTGQILSAFPFVSQASILSRAISSCCCANLSYVSSIQPSVPAETSYSPNFLARSKVKDDGVTVLTKCNVRRIEVVVCESE